LLIDSRIKRIVGAFEDDRRDRPPAFRLRKSNAGMNIAHIKTLPGAGTSAIGIVEIRKTAIMHQPQGGRQLELFEGEGKKKERQQNCRTHREHVSEHYNNNYNVEFALSKFLAFKTFQVCTILRITKTSKVCEQLSFCEISIN